MKILLVEDDAMTIESIKLCLEVCLPGSVLVATANGLEAVKKAADPSFDVIILDLGLPDIEGIEVLKQIRSFSGKPAIVLSAKHDSEIIARTLELGADDYILKPYDYHFLLDRLNSLIRPNSPADRPERSIIKRDLLIDPVNRRVMRGGNPVSLTLKEWHILDCLLQNSGRLVPVEVLAKYARLANESLETSGIESTISQLKTKLGDTDKLQEMIVSEHGLGYRLVES